MKSEIRNSKSETNPKSEIPRTETGSADLFVSDLGFGSFGFVSDFEFRISDFLRVFLCATVALLLSSCQQQMAEQPKYLPLDPSAFFPDGQSARPLVDDTVARGHLRDDPHFFTGKVKGEFVTEFPEPVTGAVLKRGQDRYRIYCAMCHGPQGDGNGIIARQGFARPGFTPPPNLNRDLSRGFLLQGKSLPLAARTGQGEEKAAPLGYLFDVVTHGYGSMPSYAEQIPPADRWAILAYVRALQYRSQGIPLRDLPAGEQQAARAALEGK
jgi:mono/diheme cytochrome c family protein